MILDVSNKNKLFESLFKSILLRSNKNSNGQFLYDENTIVYIKQSNEFQINQNLSAMLNIPQSTTKEFEVSVIKNQYGQPDLDQILYILKYEQNLICKLVSQCEPQILLLQDLVLLNTNYNTEKNIFILSAFVKKEQVFEFRYKADHSAMIKDSQNKSLAYLVYQKQGKIFIRVYTNKLKTCCSFSFQSQSKYFSYFFSENYEKIVFTLGQTFILCAKERSNDQQIILFAYFKTKQKKFSQRIEINIKTIQSIEISQYKPHLGKEEQELLMIKHQKQTLLVYLVDERQSISFEKVSEQFLLEEFVFDNLDPQELINLDHKEIFMHDFIIQLPCWKGLNQVIISKFMIDHLIAVQTNYNIRFCNLLVYSISYGLKKEPIFVISVLRYLEMIIQIIQLVNTLKDFIEAIWKYLPVVQNDIMKTYLLQTQEFKNHAHWVSSYVESESSDLELVWNVIYKIRQKTELFQLV